MPRAEDERIKDLEKEIDRLTHVIYGNADEGLVSKIHELIVKTEELNKRTDELEKRQKELSASMEEMKYKMANLESKIDLTYKLLYRFVIPLITSGIIADIILKFI